MANSNSSIVVLATDEISSISDGILGKKPRAFGIRQGDVLTAAAIFCNPRTREAQSAYTTELLVLEAQDESQVIELVQHFMSLPKTIDFFVSSEASSHHPEAFEAAGMSYRFVEGIGQVHEWHNPSFRSYTYRITSTADDGYYYGRHGTWLADVESMLRDGYMGSGGVKFKNWVKAVGKSSLRKEIIEVHSTWGESVAAEVELVGDLNRTDPRCKNSMVGGTSPGGFLPEYTIETCPIHGETKFRGGCKKCSMLASQALKECPIHGETLHLGYSCYRCNVSNSWSERECPIHGLSAHNGGSCQRCVSDKTISMRECPIHGLVKHHGDSCSTCTVEGSISVRECSTHGETKHVGDHCKKCMAEKSITEQECSIHGLTTFKGEKCAKCSAAKAWTVEVCSIHGETKHRSGVCETCTAKAKADAQRSEEVLQECAVHGLTAHYRGKCKRCRAQKQITLGNCPIHGETKFNGDTCGKCATARIWTVEECSIHGETKHRSGKCERCAKLAQWEARKAREAEAAG